MKISELFSGLYLIRQKSVKLGVDHYAILDVGGTLSIGGNRYQQPVIIHQRPPQIQIEFFPESGSWQILGKVREDLLDEAILRINQALQFADYNLFSNNCEQFARYIAEGQRYSTQLQTGVALSAFAGFLIWAANNPEA